MSNQPPLGPTLQNALNFSDIDLQANQQGRLTKRQRNRVFVRPRVIYLSLLLITVFIGLISAIVIIAVLMGTEVSVVGVVLALGGEVITVGLGYLVWWLRRRYNQYLKPGQVQSISGPVTCYELKERLPNEATRMLFYVRVEDLEFEVNAATLVAFTDGQAYTLYYVPRPLALLSAE
jgi:hypothetical protein